MRSGPGHHAVDRLLELREADQLEVVARREQRGLVHEVGEVGTGEPGRAARDDVEVDARRERLLLAVHREDRLASLEIGTVDDDLAVEATRAQQRGIEDVGTVRGREEDHALLLVEAVHLHQQLVERLLALVVAAAEPGTAVTADRVDLVDEHDRGCAAFACSKRSRTRDAPTPTNISTKSEPLIEKNGTPASPATALASSVLPVPGGP